jgi:hypothetical protein
MTSGLIVAPVATITVGSRMLATTLLPAPRGALSDIVRKLPAPLFAAMAAIGLVEASGPSVPSVLAVGAALAAAATKSMLPIVLAGLAGYLLGAALTSQLPALI